MSPNTVTVCGIFQFAVVKDKLDGKTLPACVLELVIEEIFTLAVGGEFRTTVKEAFIPETDVWLEGTGLEIMIGMSINILL